MTEDAVTGQPGPKAKSKGVWWAPCVALFLTFVFPPSHCICGYYDRSALPYTAFVEGLACYGWVASKAKFPWRILHIVAVIIAFFPLFKNVVDVLWLGHHPVW